MKPVFIFDLGKVLVDFDYAIAARKIAARSAKSPQDLHAFLGGSPLLLQYETGTVSRQEFFDAIRADIGFKGDLAEFGSYFADIFSEMAGMIELQADLRKQGFKTYIFSNTNDLATEHITKNFPFFKNFDGYIYSYEVGSMKPQPKIYEAMEAMCGAAGGDLIYFDDRLENIEAGKVRGWKAILHETAQKSRGEMMRVLGGSFPVGG
jgi:HAD superfamily hydrolase (TIGR01509 family)